MRVKAYIIQLYIIYKKKLKFVLPQPILQILERQDFDKVESQGPLDNSQEQQSELGHQKLNSLGGHLLC